jgi:hypothetical protein
MLRRACSWLLLATGLLSALVFSTCEGLSALFCGLVPLVAVSDERAPLEQLVCPAFLPRPLSWPVAVAGLVVVPLALAMLAHRLVPDPLGSSAAQSLGVASPVSRRDRTGVVP